jgi:hypothetical protein
MVDGVFSRAFKTGVRPVELGRRMAREMDEHRSVDVRGRRIVPNEFAFLLSPFDFDALGGIQEALVVELEAAAREHAAQENYHFMGPVAVELVVKDDLKPGRFLVATRMRESEPGNHVAHLLLGTGERITLGAAPARIGRLDDCAVMVSDANVSRHHAEVRPGRDGHGYVVCDLGSTNGTLVNGLRIEGDRPLADGDLISVGSTHLRFEAR